MIFRDVGVHIREKIKLSFGSGGLKKPEDQEKCDRAFYSLKRLADNHHKTLYHRSSASCATGLNLEQCKSILSTEFLNYLEEQRSKYIFNVFEKSYELNKPFNLKNYKK